MLLRGRRVLVAITGASGVIYGARLVAHLAKRGLLEAVIYTPSALIVAREEGIDLEKFIKGLGVPAYLSTRLDAPYASSSRAPWAMVVAPCSMKTLAALAHGYSDNLVTRAALAVLRLGRKLVLVVRETPLGKAELRNMLLAAENGAIILPAAPAFYTRPRTLSDIVDFVVGKILDVLGIEHSLYQRWRGYSNSSSPK
ncbi:UbiX family flavin prenyltransferase [Hyperthermus butylicus]|uniref:Flavin prenyltransferase UbiX n=1 Tax=Hyperthermus butylicus (strain DSM 5456 / JCM 9403 / PLM1-5) TaxID=415426 RepID=A2BIW0_HYPBU|nr:UbiX family flavin prenyltransferase [Hyperthermus butylicus]ABM79921.1 Flavoprotein, 3-polyprenyl-4-hydroxybenzoate decarboxylase, UbiX [Hyperthermus butylicus DSM 5456]